MTRLTTADRELFVRMAFTAGEFGNRPAPLEDRSIDDLCWIEADDVVETRDTYADFVRAHGDPQITRTFGDKQIFVWRNVQFRPGQTRQRLYLVEFPGGVNASYFG